MSYEYGYLAGCSIFILESADEKINTHGTDLGYDNPISAYYRKRMDDFAKFAKEDFRPKGGPKVKVAFVRGNLDGYSFRHTGGSLWRRHSQKEYGYQAPERTWKILEDIRHKKSWCETGVINVVVNLIMVLVFRKGALGVGIATAASQWVSALCIIVYMLRTDGHCHLELRKLRFRKDKILNILRIGIPASIQNVMFNFSNVLIQSSVNSLGQVAVAGNAAAANLNSYVYAVQSTFCQAAITFTGQNLGANKYERIKKSLILCAFLGACTGLFAGGGMFLFGRTLLGLYAPGNEGVIAMGMIRMGFMGCTYFLCAVVEVGLGMLRGMGQSALPTAITLVGTCVLGVGWVLAVFPMFPCLESLYLSYPVSWILTGIFTYICCGMIYTKSKRRYECRKNGASVGSENYI